MGLRDPVASRDPVAPAIGWAAGAALDLVLVTSQIVVHGVNDLVGVVFRDHRRWLPRTERTRAGGSGHERGTPPSELRPAAGGSGKVTCNLRLPRSTSWCRGNLWAEGGGSSRTAQGPRPAGNAHNRLHRSTRSRNYPAEAALRSPARSPAAASPPSPLSRSSRPPCRRAPSRLLCPRAPSHPPRRQAPSRRPRPRAPSRPRRPRARSRTAGRRSRFRASAPGPTTVPGSGPTSRTPVTPTRRPTPEAWAWASTPASSPTTRRR